MFSHCPAHPAPWQSHALLQHGCAAHQTRIRVIMLPSDRPFPSTCPLIIVALVYCCCVSVWKMPNHVLMHQAHINPCCCQAHTNHGAEAHINPCCCTQANLRGMWRQLMRVTRISARLVGTSGSHSNRPRCTAPAVASASSETRCDLHATMSIIEP